MPINEGWGRDQKQIGDGDRNKKNNFISNYFKGKNKMIKKLNKKKNQKGFTLVELLIVIAIMVVLAAIAIPQFSAYRVRAYNTTALADMEKFLYGRSSLF